MPYSTVMPDIILPDTPEARQEAQHNYDKALVTYFCDEYAPDDQYGPNPVRGQCLNRNPWGDRKHNMCYGCMAGYAFGTFEDDPYSDDMTTGRALASW